MSLDALAAIPEKQSQQLMTAQEMNAIINSLKFFALYGEIKAMSHSNLPSGWVLCDGSAYSKTDYSVAYSKIGDSFGSDTDNFNVPDLRGRSLIGAGAGTGLTPRTLGEVGGEESVVLTEGQLPSHSHDLKSSSQIGDTNLPLGNVLSDGNRVNVYNTGAADVVLGTTSIGDTGNGDAVNNMQPFTAINYYIFIG